MKMLQKLNKMLEKIMPMITPASVVTGVLLSAYLKDFSYLIPWIFAFMTFAGSLGSNFKSMKEAMIHPVPILAALGILHVLMPLWALGIGHLAFHGDAYTITGLVLAMVIPTGITSFIWSSIYKGDISKTLSIILVDTMLSPFIVPLSLSIFIGQTVHMDVWGIMKGLLGMVVIPSLVGMFLNHVSNGKVKDVLGTPLAPFSKMGVGITVMLNGAVVAPYLREINFKLLGIIVAVFFIALTGYWLSFVTARLLKKDRSTVVALTFTGGMRNISAGAVLAVSYFPPAVAVPVVVGMLFQQTLASVNGAVIDKYYQKKALNKKLSA